MQFRSSPLTRYLLAGYTLLIVYASLYPFKDWQYRGVMPWEFVGANLPQYITREDVLLNMTAYVPLGFLVAAALIGRLSGVWLVLAATAAASTMSFAMEATQSLLPTRVSSNLDCVLNSAGGLVGAIIAALVLAHLPAASALYALRHRWFVRDASFGLALLLAWPIAQLYPQPMLFAMGSAWSKVLEFLNDALISAPQAAAWVQGWSPTGLSQPQQQMIPFFACLVIGLLVGTLWIRGALRPTRAIVVLLLIMGGCAGSSFSNAMSYGPSHSFEWFNAMSRTPLLVGSLLALVASYIPPRWCAVLGLLAAVTMLGLINQLPEDPYYALNLQAWQQGRWIRLHGVTQWLAMAWPYVLTAYFAKRLVTPAKP